jgi:hypothetical protein
MRLKPGLNPNEVIGFFNLPNPSSHIMALELTQPLTEMSTKESSIFLGDKAQPVHKADNLNAIFCAHCLENVGTSMFHTFPQHVIGIALLFTLL